MGRMSINLDDMVDIKKFFKKVWAFINFKEIGGFGVPLWIWVIAAILFVREARYDLRNAITFFMPFFIAVVLYNSFRKGKKDQE